MERVLAIYAAVALAGCNLVFGLQRENPAPVDHAVYAATEVIFERDNQTDLVVLDRNPEAPALHVVFGDTEAKFGERIVTKHLEFRPLAFTEVRIESDQERSVFVAGVDAQGKGRFGRIRHRLPTEFDEVIEYALAQDGPEISAVSLISVVNNFARVAMITNGGVVVTKPFSFDEPTLELIALEPVVSPAAILFVTVDDLWVIDDDHASKYPIEADGSLGPPMRQDWPATPSDRRAASNSFGFGVGQRIHSFSTRCVAGTCTLTWHAISSIEPLGVEDRTVDAAEISDLITTELGDTISAADVAIYGRQADDDSVAAIYLDHSYDGTTFSTHPAIQRFPRSACADIGEVVTMTAALMTPTSYRSVVLIDDAGRGYAIGLSGICTALALHLP